MSDNSPEVQKISVPEGASVLIINHGQAAPEVPPADAPSDQWSSMEYWGKPTPEQAAHEAAFARQIEDMEAKQNEFNQRSEAATRLIRFGLVGAGVLAVVGIVSQLH